MNPFESLVPKQNQQTPSTTGGGSNPFESLVTATPPAPQKSASSQGKVFSTGVNKAIDKAKETYGEDSLLYKATAPARVISKVGAKALDFLTGSTQKFGTTAGETFAANKNIKLYDEALQTYHDLEYKVQKEINDKKKRGEDTSRLEQVLADHKASEPKLADFVGEDTARRLGESFGQNLAEVGGQALGTAVEATGVGALKGVKGVGLAKNIAPTAVEAAAKKAAFNALPASQKLLSIGKDTLKTVATVLPFGYASDVSQGLQGERGEDRTGGKAFIPGAGTALSAAIPVGIGAARALRVGTDAVLPHVAANLSGEPVEAYQRRAAGQLDDVMKGADKKTAYESARSAQSRFRRGMINEFGQGLDDLSEKYSGTRIGLNDAETKSAQKIADAFGFDLPQNVKSLSGKETAELITRLNDSFIPNASSLEDVRMNKAVQSLKNALQKKGIDAFGGVGGDFDQLYSKYASKSKVYKDISGVIGKVGDRTPTQINTARNRLYDIFNDNKSAYLEAVQNFEKETGERVLDRVAAARLNNTLPKTLRGGSPTGIIGLGSDLLSLLSFPLSSPKMGSWIIKQLSGQDSSYATKILNQSPKVRQAIYDAVNKDGLSFMEAVNKFVK